jgi:hypothetical protein
MYRFKVVFFAALIVSQAILTSSLKNSILITDGNKPKAPANCLPILFGIQLAGLPNEPLKLLNGQLASFPMPQGTSNCTVSPYEVNVRGNWVSPKSLGLDVSL